ncbi:AfsR/SARP family transcriptional regulator [Micromonospora sp. NBC_01796]|uniref:AfsR/SARP family transcriptional regulator n=1 Tax=Micromonospora sp. NBC_01796 TaxID=2975987 RepID=UPI002DD80C28|nr:BTAD domain-containing putative transcriptional regulator [Micromonospora sp. NBC_01796]WSA88914.1 tetratricopeptide repeat protein [Micromonospora sp. NBC_01796]
MRFGILGPLEVDGGITVTAGRDRTVLTMLLLRAGRTVPVDELVDAVWGDDPPATSRAQLQTCVSRLRRLFTQAGMGNDVIVTDPVGYGFRPGTVESDAQAFTRLVDAGRVEVAEGRLPAARQHFRDALALWRGPALGGISGAGVRRAAVALDEERTVVTEECVEVELRLGRDGELIGELTDLVARHPLRERLRSQLMRALCGVGRQAEALAVYRDARRALAEELGIDPGAELRELHRRILAGELPDRVADDGDEATPARCLPRDVADFTGRAELLGRVRHAIGAADPDKPVVVLVEGMAGSGKTALAVHLATSLAANYPDAHLFLDLHGHSERSPVDPGAALVTLLRQLGVGSERIPVDFEERLGRWRTELSRRRAVIVLDNAASAQQVGPLLPAGAGCLVLVTTRRRLVGLDGVQPYPLPVFDPHEAVELLARIAGPERVRAEPAAAAEVVRRCGYLPLAIRLAGARLAHRPRWTVTDLVDRLADEGAVLTELAAEERTVAGAFTLSYVQLPAPAQRMLRLLALHPGESFDAAAAAALTGGTPLAARDLLDSLVDGHLLEEPAAGRFRFHDLMRQYAANLVATDTPEVRRTAGIGLLDHLFHLVARVTRPMEPLTVPLTGLEPAAPLRPDLLPAVGEGGLDRLEPERATVVRAVRYAMAQQHDAYACALARALWFYLYLRGYHDDLIDTHQQAIISAQRLGDPNLVALLRVQAASGYYGAGQWAAAKRELEAALPVYETHGDLVGVARVRTNLAGVLTHMGRFEESERHVRLAAVEWGSERLTLLRLPQGLSDLYLQMGRLTEALPLARQSLFLARVYGTDRNLTTALCNIGHTRARLGHHRPALRLLTAALRRAVATDDRLTEGEIRHSLGLALRGLGRDEEAVGALHEALRILQGFGVTRVLVDCQIELARAVWDTGDRVSPLPLYERALASATALDYPAGRALARAGMAACEPDLQPVGGR